MVCKNCIVVFFTILTTVNGLILFGVGVAGITKEKPDTAPEFVLIVLGVTVFAISFLGTYGAIKDSEFKLNSFGSAMMVISFFQIITAIVLFTRKDGLGTAAITLFTAVIQVVGAVLAFVVAIKGEIKICHFDSGPVETRPNETRPSNTA
ncbi:uncharacterized protein LOC135933916 [Cloeon dipterum]|uniref:uncharacterized protein LOC135933916 n=1 Tax=Cloeon dipterum TaxID=197152 RepID=UPI0032207ADD